MEVNDAVSEPAFIEEFELRADVVSQGALAASDLDQAQEQMTLVDQPRAECVLSAAEFEHGLGCSCRSLW